MIDYEKLKEAHSLYDQLESRYVVTHHWSAEVGVSDYFRLHKEVKSDEFLHLCDFEDFYEIEDLIEKLKQLTQPQPKYKIGDEVWMIFDNEPRCFTIFQNAGLKYYLHGHPLVLVHEFDLYPTKGALIEAKIDYWYKMRCSL